ncbi:lamin tail domain-containing protein [Methanoregula sp.]|uniref:MBL fold metallo-hydrolase n=1 Tax=Methanoregula sp. TaxID=2052170 RepID=UPI00260C6A27|nr:lamin tail domain-containing protein [Methanoregula sp.]MDD5142151.1 lamin tail domain-containing protein [Methanoregula sp.]
MRVSSLSPLRAGACLTLILVLALLLAGCTGSSGTHSGPVLNQNTTGDLKAYFLDVGQGDSSVILFRDTVILIDAGDTDQGDTVVHALQDLGVRKIDLFVATHPHADHIGGMEDVLAHFEVGKVLDSGLPSSSSLYEKFLVTIDRKQIPYIVAERGQTIGIDPALRLLVLSPPRERTGDDLNTNSIVLRVSYGTVNLLYTGDATIPAEEALVKSGYPLGAQVLKVGHHGSSGASSAAFLSRVNPQVAILSLGKGNDYGHPHKETLERLKAAGPMVFRTDTDGTIRVESNGETISVTTEKGDAGFWHETVTATPAASATSSAATPLPTISLDIAGIASSIPANVTIPVTFPPVQFGNASGVYISRVQFDAPGDDRLNLNGEWVTVGNRGDDAVLIAGWTLSDKTGSGTYTFPAVLLLPSSSVTVFSGSGSMNDTALYMGRSSPLWGNSGDLAILRDGAGTVIDTRAGEAGA